MFIFVNSMNTFDFDNEKAVLVTKFILMNLDGKSDFHKVFKIIYFAEQKHLAAYGRPIIGDKYIAMKNGPVPSKLYDIFKFLNIEGMPNLELFKENFDTSKYHITLKNQNLDLDYFSESEIACLTQAIAENKFLSFNDLTDKSHDEAWENASSNNEISIFNIAKVGGANDELLKYISLQIENDSVDLLATE